MTALQVTALQMTALQVAALQVTALQQMNPLNHRFYQSWCDRNLGLRIWIGAFSPPTRTLLIVQSCSGSRWPALGVSNDWA